MSRIMLKCKQCSKDLRKTRNKHYCSQPCYRKSIEIVQVDCKNCNKRTKNKVFCSSPCAATWNNKNHPNMGRKCTKVCFVEGCNNLIPYDYKHCKDCWKAGKHIKDMTIAEATYDKLHRSSAFSLIRNRSRKIGVSLGWKSCSKCNYDKHIEIAHIKPVSEYPKDTLISVVNAESNLIPLCPNCHWEFDH